MPPLKIRSSSSSLRNGSTHPWQQTTVPPLRVILLLLSSLTHLQHIITYNYLILTPIYKKTLESRCLTSQDLFCPVGNIQSLGDDCAWLTYL